ncbi:SANT and BTB domain regulator of class switch recombination-like [Liolophura sinensis]|uniref:SANT and BTB domain regulator of class switch recombination-like n=1 Tax=Liolophura sinensis TaxID=3198878 RepID=UPI003158E02E
MGKVTSLKTSIRDHGPVMVIHVCDEAKNLKQDFQCSRDLLVKEMQYFAEYLSTDAQRWEEVDISVHCDVQIFDWLMKYVKRGTKEVKDPPKLEASNVVSILISSDFLKMDALVSECVEFCHRHMSAIVATPCNMNCINDKLVSRIAELFTHSEADEVKDRKDKFKSKLFAKKIEKLFEPDYLSTCSPENATTLYRCSVCKKLLTKTTEKKIKCMPSRMTVDMRGKLTYGHVRDTTFDINEYLLQQKAQLKSWRDVYWRLWGTINFLSCDRCGETFACSELGHCRYHPEPLRYENDPESIPSCIIGTYPCCHQKNLRFDPTQQNKGCRVRDHIVMLPGTENLASSGDAAGTSPHSPVYDDLLSHRDIICVPYQRLMDASEQSLSVFKNEEIVSNLRNEEMTIPLLASMFDTETPSGQGNKVKKTEQTPRPRPRLQALTVQQEVTYDLEEYGIGESDDEVGDEEQPKVKKPRPKKSRVTIDPQAILLDAPAFDQTKKSIWDNQRSMRWNQDAQRQEDQRRMKQICKYLTKLRLNQEKIDKQKPKEYAGGIFSKLDAQWRAAYVSKGPAQPQFSFRSRPRFQITK